MLSKDGKTCTECGMQFKKVSDYVMHICAPYQMLKAHIVPGTDFTKPLGGKSRWSSKLPIYS